MRLYQRSETTPARSAARFKNIASLAAGLNNERHAGIEGGNAEKARYGSKAAKRQNPRSGAHPIGRAKASRVRPDCAGLLQGSGTPPRRAGGEWPQANQQRWNEDWTFQSTTDAKRKTARVTANSAEGEAENTEAETPEGRSPRAARHNTANAEGKGNSGKASMPTRSSI